MPQSISFTNDSDGEKEKEIMSNFYSKHKNLHIVTSDNKSTEIINILEKNNIKYSIDDTTVNYGVVKETRDYEVEKILRKISGAKLNITDRFHGIIFSVITNTPVIVFKSLDHKIEYGVRWFKHLDWVHYVEEKDDIEKIILKYLNNDIEIKKENYILKETLKERFFNI